MENIMFRLLMVLTIIVAVASLFFGAGRLAYGLLIAVPGSPDAFWAVIDSLMSLLGGCALLWIHRAIDQAYTLQKLRLR